LNTLFSFLNVEFIKESFFKNIKQEIPVILIK